MSVFASLRTATLVVPNAAGATVSIRGLSSRALRAAITERQRKAMADYRSAKELASEDVLAEVDQEAVKAYQAEAAKNPLLTYDADALITKGVTSWTLELPCSPETVEDLDEDVRDWMATEILKLSKPSLFRTAEEQEADQKNG